MKKLLSLMTLFCIVLSSVAFASCGETATDDGLQKAYDYIFQMYKDSAEVTPSDYEVVSEVSIGGVKYTVNWSVDVSEGVSLENDGKITKVDVNEKTKNDINYVLKGEIKNENGETKTISFSHKVPAFEVLTYNAYAALEDDKPVVVEGIVTGVISKSKGNTYNCLYLQDGEGGFYAYSMSNDPVTLGIETGMKVQVTGTRDTYSGTYEIASPVVEIISTEKTELTAADYTELFKNASDLKATELNAKQAFLVTLKGVEITDEDTSKGYYKFKLGNLETYVRISSSVCPLTKDDQETFKTAHASHTGWIADVTGITCIYDGAFYLTPVSADAFKYISLPEKTDAEKVDFELNNLKFDAKLTENKIYTLSAKGTSYDTVSLKYTASGACAIITDGNLSITLPENDTEVVVSVTATCGTVSKSQTYTILVEAPQKKVYSNGIITAPVKETAYKLATDQVLAGGWIYFTGNMSGNYLETTANADKGIDVYLEEVVGGYRLYFMKDSKKTYVDIYEYQSGKQGLRLTETPEAVYTWLSDANTLVANVAAADVYIGTYKTYTTLNVSKTTYISGDNASAIGVSQFPIHLVTLTEVSG